MIDDIRHWILTCPKFIRFFLVIVFMIAFLFPAIVFSVARGMLISLYEVEEEINNTFDEAPILNIISHVFWILVLVYFLRSS